MAAVREHRRTLVPEDESRDTVFVLSGLSAEDMWHAQGHWGGSRLNGIYCDWTARLAAWIDDAAQRSLDRASRDAFELGNRAIRDVVFDPLLSAPLADVQARARFIATVRRFEEVGKAIWQRFLATRREDRIASSRRRQDIGQETPQ